MVGCAGSPPVSEPNTPRAAARTEVAARGSTAPGERTQAAQREKVRIDEVAAAESDARFAVTRQVTALERSIELYGVFIERAGDDPRYAEAVVRSRGRIEDARATICFLLEKPCDDAR